ncbi:uncharacterized protein LOC114298483 [Camellia sinensis]|uniref:uncharacterized protein LOC114298483 n=1 Tax=Camellia sinensis TaxID=4442 RepID=UPI001035D88B|nr:uncharacterized protein LOC114298483 [Camellia sinensis]
MPSTCQYVGWPDLPTGLTGWEYRTPYLIPLEPPRPDHRYPPREYIEGLLGVVASLEGMVLRRETMLCASGVQVPPLWTGPSRPSRAAKRGVSARGRGGRKAPISQDDQESSEEEESAHPQSETSTGRDEDSGFGSEDGGDTKEASEGGDSDSDRDADDGGAETAQPKRVKRASRS